MKKEKKPYPILYTTTTKGSMYRNGSVNQTLYFHIDPDAELMESDPQYKEYYEDMMNNEVFSAIINKFIVSQPLKVTNDRIPFVIFKSNIDLYSLKEFCKATVQEFSFHTGKRHTAQFGTTKTLFEEMGKEGNFRFRSLMASSRGEKLTRSADFEELKQNLEYDKELMDQGIMIPYSAWKEEKRRMAESEEQEVIVEW